MKADQIIENLKKINNFEQVYTDKFIECIYCFDENIRRIFFQSHNQINLNDSYLKEYKNQIIDFANHYIFRVASKVSTNNLDKVIKDVEGIDNYLDEWYEKQNNTLGRSLVGVALKEYIPEIFDIPIDVANDLYDNLIQEQVYTGIYIHNQKDERHILIPLLYSLIYCLDKDVCNKLLQFWEKTILKDYVESIKDYPWTSILKTKLNSDSTVFDSFKTDISKAISNEVYVERRSESAPIGKISGPIPTIESYDVEIYRQGVDVYNWMLSVNDCKSYLSGEKPDFKERKKQVSPSRIAGCILADTNIIMNDRTLKKISDIECYDSILNANESESICSGGVVKNNKVSFLYSINDDIPFMSLDHLILTASGYKCIDTKTALELNPHLRIAQLKIGDVVIKYINGKKIPVVVEKINYKKNNTKLCADIHISDGFKSYITENGYICYANYPEITHKSIMDTVSPIIEDFRVFLKENQKTLENTFGTHAFSYISQLAEESNSNGVTNHSTQLDHAFISSIENTNYKIYSDKDLGFDTMSIIRGFAFFNNEEKPIPLHINDGEICWKHTDTSGYVKLYHNGFMIKGHVLKNGEKIDFTGCSSVFYDLELELKDTSETINFGRYEMGVEQKELNGSKIVETIGRWYMSYIDEEGKICESVVAQTGNLSAPIYYAVDKKTYQLYASAQFPTGIAAFQYKELGESECTNAEIIFSTLFDHINGEALKYDDIENKYESIGNICGTLSKDDLNQRGKYVSALADFLKNNYNVKSDIKASELKIHKEMYTHTVDDLINIPVPEDMAEIHKQCFKRTLNMAVYAAYETEDKSKDILGITKPIVGDKSGDITQEQAKIAVDNNDFLVNKFISAYLSYSYIKQGKSPNCDETLKKIITPLLEIDNSYEKVYYYMNGNGKKCMPSQKDYSVITNSVYNSVYKNNIIGFDYFYDNNREKWAKDLYERLNNQETLIGLVGMQSLEPDNARLTHYYSMLDILDSSKRIPIVNTENKNDNEKYSYATVLRKQVIDASFKSSFSRVKLPNASDKNAVETFEMIISEFFRNYIKGITNGTFDTWDESMNEEAKKELNEMAESYGYENVEVMAEDILTVSADISGIILSMNDPDISVRVYKFFKEYPKVTSAITTVFYILGIAAIGLGFNMLNQMTPAEKAEFALSVSNVGINMLSDSSVYISMKTFKSGLGNLSEAENNILKSITKTDFIKVLTKNNSVSQSLIDLGITSVNDVSKSSEFWGKVFRVSSKLAKGFLFITVAVAIGVTGYQLYEDVINDENPGILALDTLMILADGVFIVTEAISCFATTVCATIPIIGIVSAAVGIVLAVVSMFVKRKPPKSPIEVFVNDRLKVFVQELEMPPSDWLNKHITVENKGLLQA